jgi:hypothetical protein
MDDASSQAPVRSRAGCASAPQDAVGHAQHALPDLLDRRGAGSVEARSPAPAYRSKQPYSPFWNSR